MMRAFIMIQGIKKIRNPTVESEERKEQKLNIQMTQCAMWPKIPLVRNETSDTLDYTCQSCDPKSIFDL